MLIRRKLKEIEFGMSIMLKRRFLRSLSRELKKNSRRGSKNRKFWPKFLKSKSRLKFAKIRFWQKIKPKLRRSKK